MLRKRPEWVSGWGSIIFGGEGSRLQRQRQPSEGRVEGGVESRGEMDEESSNGVYQPMLRGGDAGGSTGCVQRAKSMLCGLIFTCY